MEFPNQQSLPKVPEITTHNQNTNMPSVIKSEQDNTNVNVKVNTAPVPATNPTIIMQTNASEQVSELEMQLVSSLAKLQKLESLVCRLSFLCSHLRDKIANR
jgi:hypothetical protein